MPRIYPKIRGLDSSGQAIAQAAKVRHVEPEMQGTVWRDVLSSEMEQPYRRPQPPAVFGMLRPQELLAKVHKGSGDLDEALVKETIVVGALQPEMLQHIVGFVILARVEARKISGVIRIKRRFGRESESGNISRYAVTFFHRAKESGKLFFWSSCMTRRQ
jgi:hypothetical protein